MAVNLSPVGGAAAQFFDNSGNVLTGGKLYIYAAGTTTPVATYTQSNGITAHTNPIVLNAAGRVADSGEIWLTDSILYKFVLKDSTDVQIATWDNIDGINSNFVAYAVQNETITATQGQTVVPFNSITYVIATDNLSVCVNGSKQILGVNYTETSATSITFIDGLNVGDLVEATTASPVATNAISAANVSYNEGSAGAIDTNVEAKLQQYISVKDFGAVGSPTAIADALAASGGNPILLDDGIMGGYVYDPMHPSEEIRYIGGAVRNTAGTWELIDDSGHDPLGLTSVEQIGDYTLRVHYAESNTKVGTLIATCDKELAPYGILGGASVSANYADFNFFCPVIVDLQNSSTPSVAPWLASYVTLNTAGTYSTVINHPARALNVDPPSASCINRVQGASRAVAMTWGPTSATITTQGTLGALVQRTGSGAFTVSQPSVAGTITAAWSSSILTITHPNCSTSSTPMVCSYNSAYRAEVYTWTATTIQVTFRNSAGAIVGPTDDAEMKVVFTRNNALFNTPMPADFSAQINLGYLFVPLTAIKNISLNNFWITGAMIK